MDSRMRGVGLCL